MGALSPTTADAKTQYVVAQLVTNLRRNNLTTFEIQKLVYDVIGVWLDESQIGDPKYPDVYVDHQSRLSVSSNNIDFWKNFHKFVLRDDVVILGGNDNEDSPFGFVPAESDRLDWFQSCTDKDESDLRIRQDGDTWVFFNTATGTKSRISFTDDNTPYVKASAPELVDLKITDYCNMGCIFCYQGSTKQGKHAPKEKIFKIIRQLSKIGVFEIAIGGGEPTLHPDFVEILKYAHEHGIKPNFTTYNLSWMKKDSILKAVAQYAGGVGISIHSMKDLERFKIARDTLWQISDRYPQVMVMAQHVLGTLPVVDTTRLFEYAIDKYIPLLILGYKDVGFGKNFNPDDFSDFPTVLKLSFADKNKWCSISVDTAIINQYPDLLKVLDVSEILASSEEGKFSCYIDAVKDEMGPSSYAPDQMSSLPTTYRGIKKLFATY